MDAIRAKNGQLVTEEMIDGWGDALDRDEWPATWKNVGKVVNGRPPMSAEGSAVLSVKVPPAMKRAIEMEARAEGVSSSDLVRTMIASGLVGK